MATVDVTIKGAGVFGLSVAWACVQAGASVRVIDPNGVASGASGGIVGALAPHVPEQWNAKKAFQLDSLLMAEDWWRDIEDAGGVTSGYGRTGRLQPIADEAALALAKDRTQGARTLWKGRAIWEVVMASGDFAPASPTGALIHDTLSARLHPARACTALAAAITARGGDITTEGQDEGYIVWATGWDGLNAMTAQHSRMVGAGIKGQAVLLDFDARTSPQLFVDGVHIIPHANGTTAIGSTTEREFDDATATDTQCDSLLEKARAAVPILTNAPVIKRWAGARPRSRTRAPMLGKHPFKTDQFIANGGFKIGFGMAPLAAQQLAKLMLTGDDSIPPEFDPRASL